MSQLATLDPAHTVLFFGSGSSIPSGAPSVPVLLKFLAEKFELPNEYSLPEMSTLVEVKHGRKALIEAVESRLSKLAPTGSLLNVPLYNWRNIYTTNYDELIEKSYERSGNEITVVASNFDFTIDNTPESTKLYKLHGTIGKDISSGHQSRIILTEGDYDLAREFREVLHHTLAADLANSNLLIVGYSLRDPHIKESIELAIELKAKTHQAASVSLLLYEEDENRALLYEKRGVRVAFGSIDDLFVALDQKKPSERSAGAKVLQSLLDDVPALRPVTIEVAHEIQVRPSDARSVFNGRPGQYSDIRSELTFKRDIASDIATELEKSTASILLGASGTGKTTLARQAVLKLLDQGWHCWEHKDDHRLQPNHWRGVAKNLAHSKGRGVLFVDEAHGHLFELSQLIEHLVADDNQALSLLVVSPRNHWDHRTKSLYFHSHAAVHIMRTLSDGEIGSLLNLSESSDKLAPLIDAGFRGFSRAEKHRRLKVKCESDTFVCLRNVFATEKFDDIILREYAGLDEDVQDIYKLVAAMEASGVKVHRQLVARIVKLNNNDIASVLNRLQELVSEYTVSDRNGIYGWKVRHPVISDIVTKYKFSDMKEFEKLYENVIENIVPSYDIEIRTIRQICNFDSGIGRLPDKHKQNGLYRRLISMAPGERVPRHRLIRNLIAMREFEKAETEIQLFRNDFRSDGPVSRYGVKLLLARAEHAPGLMLEDRKAILEMAASRSENLVKSKPDNRDMLNLCCIVGITVLRIIGDADVLDGALSAVKEAEGKTGNPDLSKLLAKFSQERDFALSAR